MNTILITGGSGYVGTRLINRLLIEKDIKIINYDISLFGDEHLPKNKNFLYLKKILLIRKNLKKQLFKTMLI
jgi:nucleoside-diphosphate-sugar epimerase